MLFILAQTHTDVYKKSTDNIKNRIPKETKQSTSVCSMSAHTAYLLCNPAQMFDLRARLHALHLLLHSW